ncbi:MAG: single-stranded DNA-binding protein [Planctomycetes bacterium]|nr:single-stranded DNA-binding protein [Planctomycetota bacterium]
MANLNKVFLIGNLTRDPELRFLQSGTAVCEFGLAVNRTWSGANGEKREEVCFVDIVVWAKQAELCAEYLKKGRQTLVEGRLEFDQWQTPEGQKRSRLRVVADRVTFLDFRGGERGERRPGPGQPESGAGPSEGPPEMNIEPTPMGSGDPTPF